MIVEARSKEAVEGRPVFLEKLLHGFQVEAGHGKDGGVSGHDVRHGNPECMFFLVIKKGEAVEPDHSVSYPTLAEEITNCLGDTDDDLNMSVKRNCKCTSAYHRR